MSKTMLNMFSRLSSLQLWFIFTACLLPVAFIEIWYVISGNLTTSWFYGDDVARYSITSLATTLTVCGFLTGMSLLIKKNRWIIVIPLLFIFCVIGVIIITHADIYHAPMSLGAVASLYQTNSHESLEFIKSLDFTTISLVGLYILFFISVVVVVIKQPIKHNHLHNKAIALKTFTLCIAIYFTPTLIPFYDGAASNIIWRLINISNASTALRIPINSKLFFEQRELMAQNLHTRLQHSFETQYGGSGPDVAIFLLGESLRRSNMGIYGYGKNTTPKLAGISDELHIFNKAISPAPLTFFSVPKLLSLATVKNPNLFYERPSIVSIAKLGGYKTYWLSNQGSFGGVDTPATYAAKEADNIDFINTHGQSQSKDHDLLPLIDKVLQNNEKRKFIIIHTMGSHQTYERRYPKRFSKFTSKDYPNSVLTSDKKHILSTYDNSVLYTDNFIFSVISSLKKTNQSAWLVFTSDHGINLYDSKTNTHGHGNSKQAYDVPLFIWEQNWVKSPHILSAATTNKSLAYNTENLFHTLLNMLDIYIPEYKPLSDILNLEYESEQMRVHTQDQEIILYDTL